MQLHVLAAALLVLLIPNTTSKPCYYIYTNSTGTSPLKLLTTCTCRRTNELAHTLLTNYTVYLQRLYGQQNGTRWHYATLPGSTASYYDNHTQTCTFENHTNLLAYIYLANWPLYTLENGIPYLSVCMLVSFPDPPPKRKGGSGIYTCFQWERLTNLHLWVTPPGWEEVVRAMENSSYSESLEVKAKEKYREKLSCIGLSIQDDPHLPKNNARFVNDMPPGHGKSLAIH